MGRIICTQKAGELIEYKQLGIKMCTSKEREYLLLIKRKNKTFAFEYIKNL